MRWYHGAVSFATRGFPLAWLTATVSVTAGATAVPSIDFLGLIVDYVLWWFVGFLVGALLFGALEGFE